MAIEPTAEVRVRVSADRASLRRTEKEITKALGKVEQMASRGGLLSKAYTQPLGKITGAVGEFEKSLEASNARVIAFGASAAIIYNVGRALEFTARAAIDLEHKLAEVNVILGASADGLRRFGEELFDIAKITGQTFDGVSTAALEFARQGLNVEETLKRTRDAMILVRLAGMDVKSSVESITATINSFNQSIISSTQLVNKMANVDAAFAVSTNDLAKAISRVGSSAQDAGVGLDELIAMVTTAQQVTARGGSVIGNSLKTIFTRIQRPAVIANLEAFGMTVRDTQGAMLPAVTVLKNFASAYETLSPQQRAVTAEMVGGVFQVNVLKAAIGDLGKKFSIYDRALNTSVSSTDEAIQRNAMLNKTLQTLINETMANLLEVGGKIGSITLSPAIRSILESVNSALDTMKDKAEGDSIGMKMGKGILEGIGSILKGPGMMILGALLGKLLYSFMKFSGDAVKTFAGMNEGARKQAEMQMLVQNILLKNPGLIDAAATSEQNLKRVSEKVLEVIRQRNYALAQSEKLSASIAANLSRADLQAMNVMMGGGGGQTEGAWRPTNMSRGFVPNYSRRDEAAEVIGAISGGYKPGKVKSKSVKGLGRVTYNDAETVKKFPNMQQEAIMPPSRSDAGKAYKKKFQKKHGFNPYAAAGLIPNFVQNEAMKSEWLEELYSGRGAIEVASDPKYAKYWKEKRGTTFDKADKDMQNIMRKDILNVVTAASGWTYKRDNYPGFQQFLADQGIRGDKAQSQVHPLKKDMRSDRPKLPVLDDQIDVFPSKWDDKYPIKAEATGVVGVFGGKKGIVTKGVGLNDIFKQILGGKKAFDPNDKVMFSINAGTLKPGSKRGSGLVFADPKFQEIYKQEFGKSSKTRQTQEVQEGIALESALFRYINKFSDDSNEDGRRWDFTKANTVTMEGLSKFGNLPGGAYNQIDAKRTVDTQTVALSLAKKYIEGTAAGNNEMKKAFQKGIENLNPEKGDFIGAVEGAMDAKLSKETSKQEGIKKAFMKARQLAGLKSSGLVPNFATKILDRDQLSQALKGQNVNTVFDSIVRLAAQRGQISETIVGTAGIGKTSLAIQKAGGKNFITGANQLSPDDRLLVVRAAQTIVDSPEFTHAGRITYLKGAKEVVEKMRAKRSSEVRAGTSETAFGRGANMKFGSKGSVVTEALLGEAYPEKLTVLERQMDMSLKQMEEVAQMHTLTGASATIGAFSPVTKGHADMMKQGGKGGKVVAAVSKGVDRKHDVGLTPKEKAHLIGLIDPNIMAVPTNRGIPSTFEHEGKAYRLPKESTNIILGADRVAGGDADISQRFVDAGYGGVTAVQGRLGGVSGTKVRKAIVDGDIKTLKDNLPPEVFSVIQKNLPVLQERGRLIQARKDQANTHLAALRAANAEFLAQHGARKKKGEPAGITQARAAFKEKEKYYRDRIKGYSGKAWSRMGLGLDLSAFEGLVPNFAYKGMHSKDYGTTMVGRKGAMGANMTEKQVAKMTAGMRMIRGPEGETLVVGTDMRGRSGRMIATGLTARKIKKAGPVWRTLLSEVPHLFDGLAYDLVGGVAGANWDPEGTSGAMAGVKFENEMAASLGAGKPGAKKGSDIIVGEKIAQKLGTQKNLQLKLALHERSKRDNTKVVDIASSFSKYLVDILSHNIKTYGLSSVTTPDRFKQAMDVLNANPAVKKDWETYFGPMGMKAMGLVPNFFTSKGNKKKNWKGSAHREKKHPGSGATMFITPPKQKGRGKKKGSRKPGLRQGKKGLHKFDGFIPNFRKLYRGGAEGRMEGRAGFFGVEYGHEPTQSLRGIRDLEALLTRNTGQNVGGFMSTTPTKSLAEEFADKGGSGADRRTLREEAEGQTWGKKAMVQEFEMKSRIVNRAKLERYTRMIMHQLSKQGWDIDDPATRKEAERVAVQRLFKMAGRGAAGEDDTDYQKKWHHDPKQARRIHDRKRYGKAIGFDLTNWDPGQVYGGSGSLVSEGIGGSERAGGEVSIYAGTRGALEAGEHRGISRRRLYRVAEGFVPSFSRDALKEAIGREKAAGFADNQVKVGRDSRLKESGGIGVYNSTEGTLTNAINQHLSSGKTIGQLQKQGAHQGIVPNFQGGMEAGMLMASMGMMAYTMKDLGASFKELKGGFDATEEELAQFDAAIEKATESERKAKEQYDASAAKEKEAQQAIDDHIRSIRESQDKAAAAQEGASEQRNIAQQKEEQKQQITQQIDALDDQKLVETKFYEEDAKNVGSRGAEARQALAAEMGMSEQDLLGAKGKAALGDGKDVGEEIRKKELELKRAALTEIEANIEELKREGKELKRGVKEAKGKADQFDNAEREAKNNVDKIKEEGKTLGSEKGKAHGKAKADKEALELAQGNVKEAKDAKAKTKRGLGSRAMGFVDKGGLTSMMAAAPMLGGIASQGLQEDDLAGKAKVQGATTGISTVATTMQMGQAGGPWGMAIAGTVGLGMAVRDYSNGIKKAKIQEKMAEAAKEAELLGEKLNTVTAGGQAYMEGLDQYSQMMADTSGRVKPEDLAKVRAKMARALGDVPKEFQQRFREAAGDATKIKQIFGEITEDLTKTKADMEAAKTGYELQEKYGSGEFSFFGTGNRGMFSKDYELFERGSHGGLTTEAKRIEATMKSAIKGGIDKKKMQKAIEQGVDVDFSNLENMQAYAGEGFSAMLESFGENLKDSDMKHIGKMIQEVFDGVKEAEKISKEAAEAVKIKNYYDKLSLDTQKKMKEEMRDFNLVVGKVVSGIKARFKVINELTDNVKKFSLDYAKEDFAGARKVADPFISKGQKVTVDLADKSFDIKMRSLQAFRKGITEASAKSLDSITKKFLDANAKVVGQAGNITAKAGKEQLGELARNRKAQEAMVPVIEKAFEAWSTAPDDLNALNDVTAEMGEILKRNGISEDAAEGAAKVILQEIKENGREAVNSLAKSIQQRNQQLVIAERQAFWQRKQVEMAERLESFGGQGEIFSESGIAGLSKSFDGLSRALDAQIKGAVSGNITDVGRGDAMLVDHLLNKMNFDSLRDNLDAIAPMVSNAIAGRAADIERQVAYAQRFAGIASPGMQLPKIDAESVALEQVAAQLKLNQLPDDVAALRRNSEILNKLISLQTVKLVSKNEEAFDKALKLNGIPQNMRATALGTQDNVKATDKIGSTVLDANYETSQMVHNVQQVNTMGFSGLLGASHELQTIAANLPKEFVEGNRHALGTTMATVRAGIENAIGQISTSFEVEIKRFQDPILKLKEQIKATEMMQRGNALLAQQGQFTPEMQAELQRLHTANQADKSGANAYQNRTRSLVVGGEGDAMRIKGLPNYWAKNMYGHTLRPNEGGRTWRKKGVTWGQAVENQQLAGVGSLRKENWGVTGFMELMANQVVDIGKTAYRQQADRMVTVLKDTSTGYGIPEKTAEKIHASFMKHADAVGWDYMSSQDVSNFAAEASGILKTANQTRVIKDTQRIEELKFLKSQADTAAEGLKKFETEVKKTADALGSLKYEKVPEYIGAGGEKFTDKKKAQESVKGTDEKVKTVERWRMVSDAERKEMGERKLQEKKDQSTLANLARTGALGQVLGNITQKTRRNDDVEISVADLAKLKAFRDWAVENVGKRTPDGKIRRGWDDQTSVAKWNAAAIRTMGEDLAVKMGHATTQNPGNRVDFRNVTKALGLLEAQISQAGGIEGIKELGQQGLARNQQKVKELGEKKDLSALRAKKKADDEALSAAGKLVNAAHASERTADAEVKAAWDAFHAARKRRDATKEEISAAEKHNAELAEATAAVTKFKNILMQFPAIAQGPQGKQFTATTMEQALKEIKAAQSGKPGEKGGLSEFLAKTRSGGDKNLSRIVKQAEAQLKKDQPKLQVGSAEWNKALAKAISKALELGLKDLKKKGTHGPTDQTGEVARVHQRGDTAFGETRGKVPVQAQLYHDALNKYLGKGTEALEAEGTALDKLAEQAAADRKRVAADAKKLAEDRAFLQPDIDAGSDDSELKARKKQLEQDKKSVIAREDVLAASREALKQAKVFTNQEMQRTELLKKLNLKNIAINQEMFEQVGMTDKLQKLLEAFGDLQRDMAKDQLNQAIAKVRKSQFMGGKSTSILGSGISETLMGQVGRTDFKTRIAESRSGTLEEIKRRRTARLRGADFSGLLGGASRRISEGTTETQVDSYGMGDAGTVFEFDEKAKATMDALKKYGLEEGMSPEKMKEWAVKNQDRLMQIFNDPALQIDDAQVKALRELFNVMDEGEALAISLRQSWDENNMTYSHQLDLYNKGLITFEEVTGAFQNLEKAAAAAGEFVDGDKLKAQMRATALNVADTFANTLHKAMNDAARGDEVRSATTSLVEEFITNPQASKDVSDEEKQRRLQRDKRERQEIERNNQQLGVSFDAGLTDADLNKFKKNNKDLFDKSGTFTGDDRDLDRLLKFSERRAAGRKARKKREEAPPLTAGDPRIIKGIEKTRDSFQGSFKRAMDAVEAGTGTAEQAQREFKGFEQAMHRLAAMAKTPEAKKAIYDEVHAKRVQMLDATSKQYSEGLEHTTAALMRGSASAEEGGTALSALTGHLQKFGNEAKIQEKAKKMREAQQAISKQANKEFANTLTLFRESIGTTQDLAASLDAANEAAIRAGNYGFKEFTQSLRMGFTYTAQDFNKDLDAMGRDFGKDFRQGVAGAFSEAIKGTKNLKEAFANFLGDMADKMLDKSLQMGVDRIFGAVIGYNKGGLVKGYSSGGAVMGGSGTKDDVPAYLSKGEYVIKKSIVDNYGKDFFDGLNKGSVVMAAGGGSIGRTPEHAQQIAKMRRREQGRAKDLSEAGIYGFSYREADPDRKKEDWLGRETDQPVINTKTAYKADLNKPLTTERIEAMRKVAETYPDVAKSLDRELLDQTKVEIGEGRYKMHLKNKFVYDNINRPGAGQLSTDSSLSAYALTNENNPQNRYKFEKMTAFFDYQKERMDYLNDQQEAVDNWQRQKEGRRWGLLFGAGSLMLAGALSGFGSSAGSAGRRRGNIFGYASGGLTPDNIPALLTGGEYVIAKDTVDKHGIDFFDRLNSGELPKFAAGGLVGMPNRRVGGAPTSSPTGINRETLGAGNNTNNISITVNVDNSGNVTAESERASGTAEGERGELTDEESKELATKIKSSVLNVIVEQKRPGGMLYGS